jgi:shikimate dehydrogenase
MFSLCSWVSLAYNQPVFEPFKGPIDAGTHYCAVYGHPVRHSASPAMQNAGMAGLGLNWRYLAFEVRPESLRRAIEGARAMHFIGLNLTVPHKVLALEWVDALDDSARKWGAVNTIRFEAKDSRGQWRPLPEFEEIPGETRAHGFNTDAEAISRALREDLGIELPGKKALLLGAGGAGRTAALKLAAEGVAELYLVNRTRAKAEAIAREIQTSWPAVKLSLDYPSAGVDLLLNATSLGLKAGDDLPFDQKKLRIAEIPAVYDMIYRPAETALLKRAKIEGCRTANGLGMLLYQGARALEIWSGKAAPIGIMRAALEKNIYG